MSSEPDQPIGAVTWRDLTVPDAQAIRDFYADVVGWRSEPLSMGDYDDYCMLDANGQTVAGICHARGTNSGLPAQWLVYITVENADECARRCVAKGGEVLDGPRDMGGGRFCVIRDPAGAVAALFAKAV